jgi:predicted Ser/Thr protein kinase
MEGFDPLAQTATASPEQGTPVPEVSAPPESIGRFRVERQLGAGAMGVVYAAFDPDLERRVAVKVLRAAPGNVARNRLLREARAMARLSHPNVVTVHEVGTSGEQDYVATELITGSNLSEWLRAAPRSKREIVDAYLAAGRGLAAAHEAGLVHRDFKPHNVLRSDEGRIVVTDFGLARASHAEDGIEPVFAVDAAPMDPGSLEADLTRTGALVGTPGYMAPEQWAGLDVDAAADQFSFCVALWEAVAGQRPFQGQTIDELRVQVQRPPTVTDATEKIPRALRNILMRGLSRHPAERYPTMRALIEEIEVARRRPRRIIAMAMAAAVVLVVIGALAYATQRGAATETGCPSPILTAEEVWSPAKRALMPERVALQFDRKIARWRSARDAACRSDSTELRRVRTACLDAVISTIDLAVKAMSSVDEATRRASDVTDLAAWSAACMLPTVPTLRVLSSERLKPAAVLMLRAPNRDEIKDSEIEDAINIAQGTGQGGCERAAALYIKAYSHLSKASFGQEASVAEDAIEACGDDYLRARIAVLRALRIENPFYGPEEMALLRKATAAVARVADTSMLSHIEFIHGRAAFTNAAIELALEHLERARQLAEQGDDSRAAFQAQWLAISARSNRGRPSDLVNLVSTGRALYEQMVQAYGGASSNLWPYRQALAALEWRAGNLERSRQLLAEARRDPSRTNTAPTRVVRGKVLNDRGRALSGVTLLAIPAEKTADVDDFDLALWDRNTLEDVARTITATDGTFEFDVATSDIYILARAAGVAAPVTKVVKSTNDLVLRATATGTVHGTIDYADSSQFSTRASIGAGRKGFHFVAPVAEGGHYEVANIPTGWYEARALSGKVSEFAMSGRPIRVDAGRRQSAVNFGPSQGDSKVHIIVRNERAGALDVAQIYVVRGRVQATTVKELRPILDAASSTNLALARQVVGERAPQAVRAQLHAGDLLVTVEHLEAGPQSVCAIGLSGDLGAEDFLEKLQDSADKLDVRCKTLELLSAGEQVLLISVPPMMRVD